MIESHRFVLFDWFMACSVNSAISAYMKRIALTLFAASAACLASPALAQDRIGTIERGTYNCELPGDAAGTVGIPQPDESFTITAASRYSSPQGEGTYLRRGNVVTMTSGPRNGTRYAVESQGYLRKIENGQPGRLRCVRRGGS